MNQDALAELRERIINEAREYVLFCYQNGMYDRVQTGIDFIEWMQSDEAQKIVEYICQIANGEEDVNLIRAAVKVMDQLKTRNMSQIENWDIVYSWLEDILWFLFALKDLDIKAATLS